MADGTVRALRRVHWEQTLYAACVLLVLSTPALFAQTTGTVAGLVRDSADLVAPQASVTLFNEQTGRADARVTDANGRFVFALVPPGTHQIVVERAGFAPLTREVTVGVGSTTTLSIVLAPAQITAEVVVPAHATPIDSSGGPLRTSVPGDLLAALPDFTRNSLTAVNLAAGVDLLPGGYSNTGQMIGPDGGTLIANGVRRSQHSYYLDGANNASGWRNTALQMPNPDAVELVQVQSAGSGVQFGAQPGAVVNVVTRSGGNAPHLTAFHFFHDRSLNASRWSDTRAGLPKPDDTQKQYGITFGGPLVRDRTFVFVSVGRFRTNNSTTQVEGRFPTVRLKDGDFSEVPDFVAADGTRIPFDIKDPVSGASLGKSIPLSRMNPASRTVLALLPTASQYYEDAVRQIEKPATNDEYIVKLDSRLTGRQLLSGLLMQTRGRELDPSQDWIANTVPAWGALQRRGGQTSGIGTHRWLLSPAVSIESRASWVSTTSDLRQADETRAPSDLGISIPFAAASEQLPTIDLSSGGGFRAANVFLDKIIQRNHRIGATGVWTTGAQTLTFGGHWHVDAVRFEGNRALPLWLSFSGRDALNGPITGPSQIVQPASSRGIQDFAYVWADFLLGRVDSFFLGGTARAEMRSGTTALFLEHAWRSTDRISLTTGLRYELVGDFREIYGQAGGVFVPGHQSDQYPNAPRGVAWPGDSGISSLIPVDRNNLAPQVRAAFDVAGDGSRVLRGAAGLHYGLTQLAARINSGTSGFGAAWPGGANALLHDPFGTARVNPYDDLPQYGVHNPVPSPVDSQTPATFPWESLFVTRNVRGVPTRVFTGGLLGFEPDLRTPATFEFEATIEQRLRPWWIASVGYVGNRGYHQPYWRAANAPLPEWGGDTSDQSMQDRRPFPEYGPARVYSTSLGTTYDSLQATTDITRGGSRLRAWYVLARTLTPFGVRGAHHGLTLPSGFPLESASAETIFNSAGGDGQVTYPYAPELDRAEVGRRHAVKVFGLHAFPTVSGGRVRQVLLNGWSVSGAFHAASGVPLNVVWGFDANADGSGDDRPSYGGTIDYPRQEVLDPTGGRHGAIQYIGRDGFVGPCGNQARSGPEAFCPTSGNLPRNAARGVPMFNLDLAVMRDLRIRAGHRLQLRLEVFNVTNSSFLGLPELNLSSPFFGQVSTRVHEPRRMQVGLKYAF
jgi:hypothetical protein